MRTSSRLYLFFVNARESPRIGRNENTAIRWMAGAYSDRHRRRNRPHRIRRHNAACHRRRRGWKCSGTAGRRRRSRNFRSGTADRGIVRRSRRRSRRFRCTRTTWRRQRKTTTKTRRINEETRSRPTRNTPAADLLMHLPEERHWNVSVDTTKRMLIKKSGRHLFYDTFDKHRLPSNRIVDAFGRGWKDEPLERCMEYSPSGNIWNRS